MSESDSDASSSDSEQDSAEERPAKVARVEETPRGGGGEGEGDESGSGSDVDDPEDDDDEYDDEELETYGKPSKLPHNDYVLDEAIVDEDYDTDGEEGFEDLPPIIEKRGKGRDKDRDMYSDVDASAHRRFMQEINESDADKIVEAMTKRFSGYDAGSYAMVEDDPQSLEIQQQRLLPGERSINSGEF